MFVLSDLLFCGLDRRECFSVDKGVSCALVTVGTVLFAWASSRAARTDQGAAAAKQSTPGVSFFAGHDGDSNMILGSRTGEEAAADYLQSATPAPAVPVLRSSLVVGSRAAYSPLLSDDAQPEAHSPYG